MKKIYVILFLIIVIIGLNIYVYFNNKMPTQELSESEIKELFYNIKKYNNIYVETITEGENFKQVSKRYQKNGIILTKEPDEKNTYIYWVNTNTNESLVIQEGHKVWYKSEIDDEDKNNYKFIEYEKYNKAKCAVVQITTGNNETNRNTNDIEGKAWVDLKTGVILKMEYKNDQGEEYKSYSNIILNKVKDEDIVKPNLEGYTEWKMEQN